MFVRFVKRPHNDLVLIVYYKTVSRCFRNHNQFLLHYDDVLKIYASPPSMVTGMLDNKWIWSETNQSTNINFQINLYELLKYLEALEQ